VRLLRKVFAFFALVGVAFAAIVVYRRRFHARHERIDLYYEDGSLVSLEEGSPEAERLLPLAHDVLTVSRAA
jgi:hypothetical protein